MSDEDLDYITEDLNKKDSENVTISDKHVKEDIWIKEDLMYPRGSLYE